MRAAPICAVLVALTIQAASAQTATPPPVTDAAAPAQTAPEPTGSVEEPAPEAPDGQLESTTELAQAQPSGTSLGVSGDQQASIRTALGATPGKPVAAGSLGFDIAVGAEVGGDVALSPLPAEVAEIVPEYQGHQFFVLDDSRIVIVNPSNGQIVLIVQ